LLEPEEIGEKKVRLHREALELFRKEESLAQRFSLEDIWKMREEWIHSLFY
jgi:hypothetical protein